MEENNGVGGKIDPEDGCLIDFNSLEIGDILVHITRGRIEVIQLLDKKAYKYPILFKYLDSSKRKSDEESEINAYADDCCSATGKLFVEDLYPTIYKTDPFKYTLQLLNEKDKQINLLNDELLNSRRGVIGMPDNGFGGLRGIGLMGRQSLINQYEAQNVFNQRQREQDSLRQKLEDLKYQLRKKESGDEENPF